MDFDTQGSGICQSPKDDILTIKGDLAVFLKPAMMGSLCHTYQLGGSGELSRKPNKITEEKSEKDL